MFPLFALLVIFSYAIVAYQRLSYKRNKVDQALLVIDGCLKKRFDLLPEVVALLQPYAAREKDLVSEIGEWQGMEYAHLSEAEKAAFDACSTEVEKFLQTLAKEGMVGSDTDCFLRLQRVWNETEEPLKMARRDYEMAVTVYNRQVRSTPSNVIANLFDFTPRACWEKA